MRIERYHACASFVKELHKNQVDKGGGPYYHHLYEVADNAKQICNQLNISDENFVFDCMEIGLKPKTTQKPFKISYRLSIIGKHYF